MTDNGITLKSPSRKHVRVVPPSTMTPKLASSVVLAKDLKEQPESSHVLLVGAGRPNYYAIDSWFVNGDMVTFTLKRTPVYACRVKEGAWAVVSRAAITVVTEEELSAQQHADQKALEDFFSELDPDAWKEAQEMAKHGQGADIAALLGGGVPKASRDDVKPVPGQYL